MSDPQFILVLLAPAHGGFRTADLEYEIILMPGAHLCGCERALCAIVEPDEDRREILHGHVHGFEVRSTRRSLKCFTGYARLFPLRNHRCDVAQNMCDP